MTTVDLTLGTSRNKGDEFGNLTAFNMVGIYGHAFTELFALNNYTGSDDVISQAGIDVCGEIRSDVDDLADRVREELERAKKLSKQMFPIRNRLEILKLFITSPKLFIYAYNRRNGN